jgi:hypothetical protein
MFIATLRAVASWLFFCVALSLRINSDMLVASASAARTALKNSQLIRPLPDESHAIYGTGHKLAILFLNVKKPIAAIAPGTIFVGFCGFHVAITRHGQSFQTLH